MSITTDSAVQTLVAPKFLTSPLYTTVHRNAVSTVTRIDAAFVVLYVPLPFTGTTCVKIAAPPQFAPWKRLNVSVPPGLSRPASVAESLLTTAILGAVLIVGVALPTVTCSAWQPLLAALFEASPE